ncbi:MAG: hypothetical protein Q9222_005046 [Ikaeria aurantiellina]
MDRLPPELLHLVLDALPPKDLLNLRLTCKMFADMSASHLLSQCELMFTLSSFQRLKQISQHPIYSQHVKSLVYYADTLKKHHDEDEWYRALWDQLSINRNQHPSIGPKPNHDASEREWRTYRRNVDKFTKPEGQYTRQQLKAAWKEHCTIWRIQQRLRKMNFGEDMMIAAIARFPNLKHISLSNFLDLDYESDAVERLYKPTLEDVMGDGGYDHSCGVPQFFSLLRGVQQANISLESLAVASISWEMFCVSDEELGLMRSVFRPLKRFKLSVLTSQENGWHDPDEPIDNVMQDDDEDCIKFLRRGRVADLMSSMTEVRAFDLCFNSNEMIAFPFAPTYKILTYPNLTEISFNNLYAEADNLLDFFMRHAQTLRSVHVANFTLESGSWLDVFHGMRNTLHLKRAGMGGFLVNDIVEDDHWEVTRFHDDGDLSRSVEQFVLGGPEAPTQEALLEKRKEIQRRQKIFMEEAERNNVWSM